MAALFRGAYRITDLAPAAPARPDPWIRELVAEVLTGERVEAGQNGTQNEGDANHPTLALA